MSDKSFTFFEFHFHDRFQFGPGEIGRLGGSTNELAAADEDDGGADTATDEDKQTASDEGDESGPCIVCRLLGLGVLAAAAYAVQKLLGGEPSGLDALDDIEAATEPEEDSTGEPDEDDGSVSIEVTSGEEAAPSSGSKGLAAAAVVGLLVVLALVARKLLGDAVEELEIPEELAEE